MLYLWCYHPSIIWDYVKPNPAKGVFTLRLTKLQLWDNLTSMPFYLRHTFMSGPSLIS